MAQQNLEYQYSPLQGPGSFRILKLLPGDRQDRPRIEILQASMDENPDYEAVSYVWGQGGRRFSVLCEPSEAEVKVTPNCMRVLKDLRFSDKPRNLWIDAICIDQEFVEEKNHQLKLMDKIYKHASRVLICPVPYIGWRRATFIHTFFQVNMARSKRNEQHLVIPTRFRQEYHDFQQEDQDSFKLERMESLRPDRLQAFSTWFGRTWVIQEAALAREAVMMFENAEIPFDEILEVLEVEAANDPYADSPKRSHGKAILSKIDLHRSLLSLSNKTLMQLAYQSRASKTTIPEDKLYALVGIASDGGDFRDNMDYGKPTGSVFAELSQKFINKTRNLDLLSITSASLVSERLVSWAVQWDKLDANYASILDPMGSRKSYNACDRFTSTKEQKSAEYSVLFLRGIVFDSIRRATTNSFKTSRGHRGHMRRKPGSCAEGDIVCIFSGGAVPYIVRKIPGDEGKCCFIGEAFVGDIMAGEAMKGLEEKDLQDFCLV
ncbi:heterokaryon incompatibility protein-domain-containing protein [Phyllosticta citribraziliensis]|uniref:Heterokaryon incompatibility protein-domain-containing protein n=1 Tax=Phyllosticta citribraziliensis TaxID=989973 RepID=A0ABR1LVX0_9PEZI